MVPRAVEGTYSGEHIGFNVAALTTLLLSWNYVKASNRAAAEALQRELDTAAAA